MKAHSSKKKTGAGKARKEGKRNKGGENSSTAGKENTGGERIVYRVMQDSTVHDLFLEDGKVIFEGKALSCLDILMKLLQGQKELKADVQNVKADVQNVKADVHNVKADLRNMHKDISAIAERLSRLSMSLLYGKDKGVEVEYPVIGRWMPYDPKSMGTENLECVVALCSSLKEDAKKKDLSGFVEIDVLCKVREKDPGVRIFSSPMTVSCSRFSTSQVSIFTNVFIGEYSRSWDLCASAKAYNHPVQACRTSSTKLLKKLIQVERGIVASLHYYDAARYPALVDAAAVVSPSFRKLSDPQSLLNEVLSHVGSALPHVARLTQSERMWLLDA